LAISRFFSLDQIVQIQEGGINRKISIVNFDFPQKKLYSISVRPTNLHMQTGVQLLSVKQPPSLGGVATE
jgi:hypothetical protein